MTKEEIFGIFKKSSMPNPIMYRFSLKKRNHICGFFVNGHDYANLNSKNYWYILTEDRKQEWLTTKNSDLLLLFPGDAFAKIQVA